MSSAAKSEPAPDAVSGVDMPSGKTITVDVYGSNRTGKNVPCMDVLFNNGGSWTSITFKATTEKPSRAQALDKVAEILGIEVFDKYLKIKGMQPDAHSYTYQVPSEQMVELVARNDANISFRPQAEQASA